MTQTEEKARNARKASYLMATLNGDARNHALKSIEKALLSEVNRISEENRKDISDSKGMQDAMRKRLGLGKEKIEELVRGLSDISKMPDPVGRTLSAMELSNGLELYKVSCPIGVIGVIFESRPDALVQIAALCLKSGNSVLLKGGREAIRTNSILFRIIKDACGKILPVGWISLLEKREEANEMLALDNYIDLIVPRGSNELVRHVMENTSIPVLGHSSGICHAYVDEDADVSMALKICHDSKCQYPAACNAVETILVHSKIAEKFLPALKADLEGAGVKILGDEGTRKFIDVENAKNADWDTEYNNLVVSIKTVQDMEEAIEHINIHGSRHTDSIITNSSEKAEKFMSKVDSANVFWNCSTRFSDGYRYGLGAELGISTSKVHARGPVGVDGLMTYKWKLIGKGHTVAEFSNGKSYSHKMLRREFPLQ
ncbi:glutamate-5-semialdehyde dehydrogenase [Candidatus Woesearchaeota archaeon]|nr:glutamate-5-semialdehyde dehydrogenase [Candidatus Woesearchaeota archaeon]